MVKTAISAALSLLLILAVSIAEILYVNTTFEKFRVLLVDLYAKVQSENATFDDGYAVREFWLEKRKSCTFGCRTTSSIRLKTNSTRQWAIFGKATRKTLFPKWKS